MNQTLMKLLLEHNETFSTGKAMIDVVLVLPSTDEQLQHRLCVIISVSLNSQHTPAAHELV